MLPLMYGAPRVRLLQRRGVSREVIRCDPMISLADIELARARLRGHILETPFLESRTLSALTGAEVVLKFENLQFTASFKERGALNKLATLSTAERSAGVIAMSAGNHAQGVAYHAQRLGLPALIVMPRLTPAVKVQRTRDFGAEVVLEGDTFEEARTAATRFQAERGLTLVHPYDDPLVIAGQGTVALEMLKYPARLDVLVVPVGGGGLIAGIATAVKALQPAVQIIGVQSLRFPSMYNAIRATSEPVRGGTPGSGTLGLGTIADGIAVKTASARTAEIIRRLVDDLLLVDEAELERAVLLLLEVEKTVVEGAGAAGLAALLRYRERFAGRRVGLVMSGGNIDPMLLAGIIERGMARSGRLARIRVEMRDIPGALAQVTQILADCSANIEEVHHQRAFTALAVQNAEVELVLRTRDAQHITEIVAALTAAGYPAVSDPD